MTKNRSKMFFIFFRTIFCNMLPAKDYIFVKFFLDKHTKTICLPQLQYPYRKGFLSLCTLPKFAFSINCSSSKPNILPI